VGEGLVVLRNENNLAVDNKDVAVPIDAVDEAQPCNLLSSARLASRDVGEE
jgi:hypothetical protein